MDTHLAKKVGSTQALKGVALGLIIAYLIMTWFSQGFGLIYALSWIKDIDYKFNLMIGVIAIFLAGHLLGQKAGFEILIKNKNKFWTGIKYGFLIVFAATFAGSLVGIFENIGIDDKVFLNYIVKPFFWVTFFGLIPIIVIGLWFGNSINKKASRN